MKPDELRNHAVALGYTTMTDGPTVAAAPCDAYDPAAPPQSANQIVVSYSFGCGRFPSPVLRVASPYSWTAWTTMRTVSDSLTLDFTGPAAERVFSP